MFSYFPSAIQSDSNYHYDAIGNLKKDIAEGISNINWTVYGKIKNIHKTTGIDLTYRYDGSGNRIVKEVADEAGTTKTFYVRDAQGNTMAVYTKKGNEPLKWKEQHLYGSSRLGIWQWDTIVPAQAPIVQGTTPLYDSAIYGRRHYELIDHLGNVRVAKTNICLLSVVEY